MLLLQRGTFQTLEHSIHQVQSSITSKVNLLFTGSVNQFRHAGEVGGVINLQRWNQYQIPEKRETYCMLSGGAAFCLSGVAEQSERNWDVLLPTATLLVATITCEPEKYLLQ